MTKKVVLITLISFSVYFFSWFAVHSTGINRLEMMSEDTLPAIFMPFSIIKDGNIYLDRYYDQLITRYPHPDDKSYVKGLIPFYLRRVNGHYLTAFPIITALVALPVYVLPVLGGVGSDWNSVIFLSHIASSLIMAVSAGLLYLLLKKRLHLEEKPSLLLVFVYSFASVNYAMISQALWQHGTLQLFVILSLYYFLGMYESGSKRQVFLFGLFSGLAILSRPTAALPVGLFVIYYLVSKKAEIKKIVQTGLYSGLGLSICLAFFLFYNSAYYGNISNQGYSDQLSTSWVSPFPISFLGVWLSPSKGILIFSPVFIFSTVGLYLAVRKKNTFYIFCGLIVLLHTLIISFWKHWYGGWSFGYRMSSDVIPFLILLLVPFFTSEAYKKYFKVFISCVVLSVLIQIYGVIFYDGIWHAAYDLGYEHTSWLWSIKDSEFMFDARRVLVKLNLLDKACPKCL